MKEAQPLQLRNDDEIIKQPVNDEAEILPPSNDLSSTVMLRHQNFLEQIKESPRTIKLL